MADTLDQHIAENVDIFRNLARSLAPVQDLIFTVTFIMGLAFAFKAVYSLKVYGESRSMMASHTSFKEPLIYFIVAVIFLYFDSGLRIMMATTFGDSSIWQYGPTTNSNKTINSLFNGPIGPYLGLLMQTIGIIAFVHGWILIARAASQGQPPGGTGKGLMHVVGGILAMNIFRTLEIIQNTFYGT